MASRPTSARALLGPRRTAHVLSAAQVGALALPLGDDGVVVGDDTGGRPRIVGFHHPSAFNAVLIGGLWTAQVLALRMAGTGARVAVETGRAQVWTNLVRAAGAGQECIALYDVGRVPALGPTVSSPVVVIRDCGMRPPRGRVSSMPWQAVLTLLPYLSPVAPRLLRAADLAGIQRVSPDEAAQLGRLVQLPQQDVDALPTLGDGWTLWCTRRERQYAMTQPTDAESGLLGMPRRLD
ncbi:MULTISPECIES: hypothetical protein [Streptomyces]|uniref:Uncharacterized protein n=1 Tax=Streptomyces cacaoi TaxID=1898 RepID=A0A4Y3RDU4_STRCI|nr:MULTISPECIES: hypothetical protein [Streptomyces]NNG86655.1 hypothetical protein [Streptomyces cacaoi]QHF96677.1 hypothetical protein DEH18_25695 [Streptomyces sp. NHF165]GEB53910.1 hypothetical protein SCA03_64610 [Streptomyces cacaoi]